MDWQRTLLGGGILVILLLLLGEWNTFQAERQADKPALSASAPTLPGALSTTPATITAETNSDIPQVETEEVEIPEPVVINRQLVTVSTNTLEVTIDTLGGDIVRVALPQHNAKLMDKGEKGESFVLLNRVEDAVTGEQFTYVAQSGIIGKNATDKANGERPTFSVEQSHFDMTDNQDTLEVKLSLIEGNTTIVKTFSFTRDSYLIDVNYIVNNNGNETWKGNFYGQIKRDSSLVPIEGGAMGMAPFLGAALTTSEERYKKTDFADLAEDGPIKEKVQGGWLALVQHYFISAWVPNADQTHNYTIKSRSNSEGYTINLLTFTSPAVTIEPSAQGRLSARFYVGPKDVKTLEDIAEYLDLTVDYGWLWWVAKPLFLFLSFIQNMVSNWGLSIILLTVCIKLVFFPLSAASYKSMAKMRKLQPKLMSLKDQYGDDRQRMSQELMKMYQKEKVNPMGGCLPILVQMPVFIALYWVLMEAVELRHTPFLYLADLSVKDPYFILPIIMGATMIFQQRLNPVPPDPTQAAIMKWMPVAFTFFFLWFPSGLVVYWVVNNVLSIAQQWYITKKIEAQG